MGVYEVLYFDILSLDTYKGYPRFYSKSYIPIKIGDKTKKALIYIMNKNFDYHLPRLEYVEKSLEVIDNLDSAILDEALKGCIDNISKVKKIKKPQNF